MKMSKETKTIIKLLAPVTVVFIVLTGLELIFKMMDEERIQEIEECVLSGRANITHCCKEQYSTMRCLEIMPGIRERLT